MQTPAKSSYMPSNSAQNDSAPALEILQYQDEFLHRHIGPGDVQIAELLRELGLESLQQLIVETIPSSILSNKPISLPDPIPENEALTKLKSIAANNKQSRSFIGLGYYDTYTPNVIFRNVL